MISKIILIDSMKKILLSCLLMIWFVPLSAQTYTYTPTDEDRNNTLERLIDFHADIDIQPDGTIRVTEYITIYAGGIKIRRGIVRNIPEKRVNKNGKTQILPITVLSLKRNDKESPYHTETVSGDIEIYFGSGNASLETGIHQYELVFETRGHVGFFDDYDELYWNMVGHDWIFPIEHVSATLHLPGDSEAIQWSCYTGVSGSTDRNCSCNDDKSAPVFTTTRALKPYEGFTIAVAFPRDIIQRPANAAVFWYDYRGWIIGGLAILISMICLGLFWNKKGRNAKRITPVLQFKPPQNWSPSTIRYLYKRKFDNKAFTAILLQMAVKGGIRIEKNDKKYSLIAGNKYNLTKEEIKVFDILFHNESNIELSDKKSKHLSDAAESLAKNVTKATPISLYYNDNSDFKTFGCIINLALWIIFVILLLCLDTVEMYAFYIIPLIFIVLNLGYSYLLGARTELGAQKNAELEGFRMYLGTAEKYWLETLTPPERTPEHFEEMLPYAVALDVENQWCDKFSNILDNYTPQWYQGNDFSKGLISDLDDKSFFKTFNKSVTTSNGYRPSSSSGGFSGWLSGSGGGGSSGGGGGGGGVSGW